MPDAAGIFERALPALRAQLAREHPRWSVEVVEQIDSTNSELMRRARAGQLEPVLLAAVEQTAGRGRIGRRWLTRPGDALTFSLLAPLAPRSWSGLSLAVGVALADALDPARQHGIGLKWPNDLWRQDRKLAGILVETIGTGAPAAGARHAVIGVGLNIAAPDAAGLATAPAWLREVDPGIDAAGALGIVAAPLLAALTAFETFGFAPFQARFERRDVLRGRAVTAAGPGGALLSGSAHGVGDDGALLLASGQHGMQAVHALDVSVRPAPAASPS